MSDFKPFYRVLVRDSDDTAWVPGFYSHASGRIDVPYTSILSHSYAQCIPYEGNEHLAGTADAPASWSKVYAGLWRDCGCARFRHEILGAAHRRRHRRGWAVFVPQASMHERE